MPQTIDPVPGTRFLKPLLHGRRGATAPVDGEMPVIQDIEEQEEEGNEAEGFDSLIQRAVGVGKVRGGKDNRDQPQVGEDEVEH